ncbi:TPR-like protein [Dioscorea alata]|uniref:TPR-like protein n=1 Tax=Dioscorea alata TaxID=55571 RepID=A0ACB7U7I4_DIOAL|nr:TPR-like protein [Dioscorea alata]
MGFVFPRVLNRFSNPSTVVSWNSSIRANVAQGLYQTSLLLFRQMIQSGAPPDRLTFPFVLKACARISDVPALQSVHAHIVKDGLCLDVFVATAMMDAYFKCGLAGDAEKLFDGMTERDVAAWNVIIAGLFEACSIDRVFSHFRQMRVGGILPDSLTMISLTQSCARMRSLCLVKAFHCLGICIGVRDDVSVLNTWVAAYAKCEDLSSAELVFTEITAEARSIVSWNSMMASYAYFGRSEQAIHLFCSMSQKGIRPDLSTAVSLLAAFNHSEALFEGMQVHGLAVKAGFELDVSVTNTLISLYSKCGDVEAARYCFEYMSERTRVSWTALIHGYARKGDIEETLSLFGAMEAAREKPDVVTVVAFLSACSQTGSLELGRLMNRYAIANGVFDNVVVLNALIDMYAKCGCVGNARRLFDSMTDKTVVSWTTMIAGHAMNGDAEEALDLFSRMLESKLKPNHVTFLAVLQACTHGGFLEKGWYYFKMMNRVYHIKPRLEHYACMVDLLGRRGRVKEALEFISSMPFEPDGGVWGALLGACIMHHETDIGEYAANWLFELDPQAAVSYVSMANIYAEKKRWDGVAKIRMMMKRSGARKFPGKSIVQIDGKGHSFTVEDRNHADGLQIYEILDGLALQLKEQGNVTDLECNLGI